MRPLGRYLAAALVIGLLAAGWFVWRLSGRGESRYGRAPKADGAEWVREHAAFRPQTWKKLTRKVSRKLPGNGTVSARFHAGTGMIRSIVPDADDPDVLWLATAGGVARYDTTVRDWRFWGRTEGLATHHLEDLLLDAEAGELWAVGWKGISVMEDGEGPWDVLVDGRYQMQRRHIRQVARDPTDARALIFIGDAGLFRYHRDSGAWQWLGFPEPSYEVVTTEDPTHWVVVGETSLWRVDASRGEHHELLTAEAARAEMGANRPGLRPHLLFRRPGGRPPDRGFDH